MTLEDYLRSNNEQQTTVFTLRSYLDGDSIKFYVHPTGKSGVTVDFEVVGNELQTICVCE